jgi:hypothetical protein
LLQRLGIGLGFSLLLQILQTLLHAANARLELSLLQ